MASSGLTIPASETLCAKENGRSRNSDDPHFLSSPPTPSPLRFHSRDFIPEALCQLIKPILSLFSLL